eukprot:scaffold326829_cov80-Tisochrysis_lutea.AAC.1
MGLTLLEYGDGVRCCRVGAQPLGRMYESHILWHAQARCAVTRERGGGRHLGQHDVIVALEEVVCTSNNSRHKKCREKGSTMQTAD